ncbi:MAG: non-canonical purine NTP pyrophosphatase [Chloroflexota bacterium]|nr:non-canonical purine NTP pyrophosphatase [Chloroflexota bacterium]
MTGLLLATTNPGKQSEFRRLLADLADRMVVPQELGLALNVAEPHDTYAENATAKAVAYCRASGLPTIADDSGLEVAALGWGPGVRTARFAPTGAGGALDYLLAQLEGESDRRARMVCWLAVAVPGHGPDGTPRAPRVELFSGVIEGSVAAQPRGNGGFGYDPIFQLPSGRTTAELPEADKDRISHRGQAVAAALPRLHELLADPA